MSILTKIVEKKRERLDYAKGKIPLHELKSRILDMEEPRDFTKAIKSSGERIKFIAEIKKASPSRGIIRENLDLLKIARIYQEKAVDAVSVITEEDFFSGNLNFILPVKQTVAKPILRKDFIFDEYQIYESGAGGADALLLIAALLEGAQAEEYLHLSRELHLSVLFEVHNHDELEKALNLDAGIIGINNRDLNTLAVDINTTFLLKKEIPSDKISVSESGIKTRNDVVRLEHAGIDAVLIGTSLMEAMDIGAKIDELRISA
ncbi:MAG TPA: indole-3-glycerol phosphate synthase TrpC [Nitrospiraceae bacterium]|jgi:indole-3-glycerol phosphate synthase|nr:indole-3-glycerol phosphate synthase TrpC [Nitrospiraceae bacterium]